MKAFVTGGTGFIGRHVVGQLLESGYDVYGLARSEQSEWSLRQMGASVVTGDITDRDSMREGMAGSDVVYHMAAWHDPSPSHDEQADWTNFDGTRNVLQLANELGIPKILYASSISVYGDTDGERVDESYHYDGPLPRAIDRTRRRVLDEVVEPLISQGAPVTVVMPGTVYGPGDTSWLAQLMHLFYRGRLLAVPGALTTLTYAHVADVAEGYILAAERGLPGETYILTGPAVSLGDMVDLWAQVTGIKGPSTHISARYLQSVAPVVGRAQPALHLPPLFEKELMGMLGGSYVARSDKARDELGWKTRTLQAGIVETFDWIAATEPPPQKNNGRKLMLGWVAASAVVLSTLWLISRRRGD